MNNTSTPSCLYSNHESWNKTKQKIIISWSFSDEQFPKKIFLNLLFELESLFLQSPFSFKRRHKHATRVTWVEVKEVTLFQVLPPATVDVSDWTEENVRLILIGARNYLEFITSQTWIMSNNASKEKNYVWKKCARNMVG